jgi:NADH-quinone oxidoreductase subunit J
MTLLENPAQLIIGIISILSALGVILLKKPVHACLSFLLTLLTLASFYLQLWAPFISVMQVLVYAGAILVIFMFVIVLFQDAYLQIEEFKAKSSPLLLISAACLFILTACLLVSRFEKLPFSNVALPEGYGSVHALGQALYVDFFFPFEAVGLLFLIAVVGAVYIGRKAT